ncbi:cytochrome c, partial [Mesorhizobium sp. M0578]|uniref:c-type cytochrome n=1 Tax=unclassified Mesorhizobium TaxID=325217 RepID=UPI00333BA64E
MTGMPAFGPTHNQEELWAMVAFTRRLPEMSQSEYEKITEAFEGHHQAGGEDVHRLRFASESYRDCGRAVVIA